jgi:uncharacterized protein (UPF0264 family)
MTTFSFSCKKPGLLVSVRNADEAITALAGGADVIDVKEPRRGPLGAADADTISSIVRAVNGLAPVTAALGELVELIGAQNGDCRPALADGVSLFKIGLARCAPLGDWRTRWHYAIDTIASSSCNEEPRPVAVAYADWRAAQSPPPRDVLSAAVELQCPALLIDTWNKSAGSLFDHWPSEDLRDFLAAAREQNLAVVLAGSLIGDGITAAAGLAPDLIAVRTAACDAGREGTVACERVQDLKRAIAAAAQSAGAT